MQERRAAGHDLHRARRDAERGEQRQRVALGVEDVDAAAAAPMPAIAARLGAAAPHAAAAMRWSFSPSPRKIWPTSNSATSLEAAPRIALGRRDEAGNKARAHVGKIGGDRIGERQRGLAAAEQFRCGLEMNDQVTASLRPSAASVRLARRVRFCSSVSTGFGTPGSSRGSGAGGTRSRPAMRTICSTMSALPSMSGRQLGTIALPSSTARSRAAQDRLALALRDVEAE